MTRFAVVFLGLFLPALFGYWVGHLANRENRR